MSTKDLSYYLGLKYPIELHESEGGGYFVTHPDLDGCMAEGATLEDAVRNLGDSRALWLEARLEGGYPAPEPPNEESYSGRLSLRMPPSLHARLARLADRDRISLNLLIVSVLANYAGGADSVTRPQERLRAASNSESPFQLVKTQGAQLIKSRASRRRK